MTKWKKVTALATGALMLGATLAGALALEDLSTFPAPFVENGVLNDAVIVVGKAAETADVLGAVDIAAALQAEATTPIDISGSGIDPTVSDGVRIEKSGEKFITAAQISDIQSELDDTDLPDLLAEETLDDNEGDNTGEEDYNQEIAFGTGSETFELVFDQPGDNDVYEDGRPIGYYIKLVDGADVYTYTMLLDSGVDVADSADMEANQLVLQDNTYTITEASADTTGTGVDDLTLVAGDSTVWLVQDQPYTVGGFTVTVVDVSNSEDKCGVNVDGVTKWVDEGSTEDFGDLSVGVLEVVAVYTKDYDADTCELSLGSSEITLEDGEEIVVNEVTLEGSTLTYTGAGGDWTGFTINYVAGAEDSGVNVDDIFLAPGEAWTDPVLGNWKVVFEGVTADYEEMGFDVDGDDDATFTFENNDGEEVEVGFHYDSGYMLGFDDDKPILQVTEGTDLGPDDVYLLYSTTNGDEVHMLMIEEIDCTNSDITIDDVTYDNDGIADQEAFTCDNSAQTVSLGSLGDIKLSYNASQAGNDLVFVNGPGNGTFESFYEGILAFDDANVTLTEEDGDETAAETIVMAINYDSTDGFELVNPSAPTYGAEDADNDDDSTQWFATAKGTLFEVEEDGEWLKLQHPEEDVYANVFVTPLTATVVAGASESDAERVNPFSVGLAVLDEDAESMSKNMIVVGGPCANTVAFELMGQPEDCAEGFEAGKAMLKYFDRNGDAALLVAGFGADDTMGASRVLGNFEDYDLSGDEVAVVVTSLDQISVSTV